MRRSSTCSFPKKVTRTRLKGSKALTHLAAGFLAPRAMPTMRSPSSLSMDTTRAPSWKGVGRRMMATCVRITAPV